MFTLELIVNLLFSSENLTFGSEQEKSYSERTLFVSSRVTVFSPLLLSNFSSNALPDNIKLGTVLCFSNILAAA